MNLKVIGHETIALYSCSHKRMIEHEAVQKLRLWDENRVLSCTLETGDVIIIIDDLHDLKGSFIKVLCKFGVMYCSEYEL